MAFSFPAFVFLLCLLFISQCTNTNCANDDSDILKDPSVHVFFKSEDLKVGNKMPIYFGVRRPYKRHFLPKEEADSIPFSSDHLPQLLNLFSYAENSSQAEMMALTLKSCERKPIPGEIKFCATSKESMIESVRRTLGLDTHINVLATMLSPNHKIVVQNYTVLEDPKVVDINHKQLGCHLLPYPYRIYFCHTKPKDHMIYRIPMVGDDGERIEAVGGCHKDTASFRPDHAVFKVLKTKPGSLVCHFMKVDDFFFVA